MIDFKHFKKFDRIKSLNQLEQQRLYWIFRNNYLNVVSAKASSGGGSSGGGSRRFVETQPANFTFFTTPFEQFTTVAGDIVVRTSTGYSKAFYPYDISLGSFGNGDPSANISILFTDTTPWNGLLPFKILSCDVDGNVSGDITYVKFDNLSDVISIDFSNTKDTIEEIDVAGCVDLIEFTIPSSVSLENLNVSNTNIQDLNLNGCEYLKFLDISSTQFKPVFTLDLSNILTLISIVGNNCNLFGLQVSSTTLEQISMNDCSDLSSMILSNFTGNGGLGDIQIKNCVMGPGALDNLYNSLNNANGTSNTIFIYNNPGILASDPTIAQGKGFVIDTNP